MESGQVGVMPTGILGIEIKAANGKWAGTGKGHKWDIREQASSRIEWGVK